MDVFTIDNHQIFIHWAGRLDILKESKIYNIGNEKKGTR